MHNDGRQKYQNILKGGKWLFKWPQVGVSGCKLKASSLFHHLALPPFRHATAAPAERLLFSTTITSTSTSATATATSLLLLQ